MGVPGHAENVALPLERQDTGISYVGPYVKVPELPLAFRIPLASTPKPDLHPDCAEMNMVWL